MGKAFARGMARRQTVVLCDHHLEELKQLAQETGGVIEEDVKRAAVISEVILLAVKPKDFPLVAQKIGKEVVSGKVIISILAGVSISSLRQYFPNSVIVRTMPNLALLVGKGVIGVVDDPLLSGQVKLKLSQLFQEMGFVTWVTEEKLEALTALTGSGIGLVMMMIEAMAESGVFMGFTAQESLELVCKGIEGAVALIEKTHLHPALLKTQICSPSGTTIAGVLAMEQGRVRAGIMDAIIASYQKGIEMGKK